MKAFRVYTIILLTCFLLGCATSAEVWTGRNSNPIQVVCGKSCETIYFRGNSAYLTSEQRYRINQVVYQTRRHQSVFISLCNTNRPNLELNTTRLKEVSRQIKNLGFTPVFLKPTLPEDLTSKNCVNLVRGKLKLYVQRCPNKTIPPSVVNIGSNFGCADSYNLAHMIINPWNLLAQPGDNGTEGDRVAIGVQDYRIAKPEDLSTVGSDAGGSLVNLGT